MKRFLLTLILVATPPVFGEATAPSVEQCREALAKQRPVRLDENVAHAAAAWASTASLCDHDGTPLELRSRAVEADARGLFLLKRNKDAIERYRYGISLIERLSSTSDPALIPLLDGLGDVLWTEKSYAAAEAVFVRGAAVAKTAFGESSAQHAESLLLLASYYRSIGDASRAVGVLRSSVAISREVGCQPPKCTVLSTGLLTLRQLLQEMPGHEAEVDELKAEHEKLIRLAASARTKPPGM